MPRYRSKPVEIDAVRIGEIIDGLESDPAALPGWVLDGFTGETLSVSVRPTAPGLLIDTLEGQMLGRPEDMLIKGLKGELYPCQPDIFAAKYEEV